MDLDDNVAQLASVVVRAADVVLALVNDILDYQKIKDGKLVLRHVSFDPRELLESLRSVVAPLQNEATELQFDVGLPEGCLVELDPNRLRQVLLNLIVNALKFTPSGFVRVSIHWSDERKSMLRFCVQDTGIGIPEDKVGDLFQRFSQVEEVPPRSPWASTYKRPDTVGTGLGLSISQELVSLMGDSIHVHSVEGEGSSFWFVIPAAVVTRAVNIRQSKLEQPPGVGGLTERDFVSFVVDFDDGESLSRLSSSSQSSSSSSAAAAAAAALSPLRHILVVDDNRVNLALCARMLERSLDPGRFKITTATSGTEALELCAKTEPPFDFIFLDILMPVMHGGECCKRIRSLSTHYRTLPIVALSATATETTDEVVAMGFTQLLSKPYQKETLIGVLQQRLDDD